MLESTAATDGRPSGTAAGREIAIVSESPLGRALLGALLGGIEGIEVVGDHDGPAGLPERYGREATGLLLAPTSGDEIACLAGVHRALGEGHGAELLLLALNGDARLAREALAAGASAFLTPEEDADGFVHAVLSATRDRPYVSPAVGARLATLDTGDPLTDREREVLRLVALGYTSEQTGAELFLSVRTVEAHRSSIARKLDCRDRRDLVARALRLGLLR